MFRAGKMPRLHFRILRENLRICVQIVGRQVRVSFDEVAAAEPGAPLVWGCASLVDFLGRIKLPITVGAPNC